MVDEQIQVTRPFLPPLKEYTEITQEIWKNNWLTNDGPLVRKFESEINKNWGVNNFAFVSNGTVALQIAIESLAIEGEIITTPFSYVATCTSILWQKCVPVFVDIDENTFNVDPSLIQSKISEKTGGFLFTHVFGNPCDNDLIKNIAKNYNIPLIYDAAHAYGVTCNGENVMKWGDVSCISFHATKLLHTVEGGGVVSKRQEIHDKVLLQRNFGHNGFYKYSGLGINGKNSELHAAMGLVNLRYIEEVLKDRERVYKSYKNKLVGSRLRFQKLVQSETYNYSYFPIVLESESSLLKLIEKLNTNNVFPRRYFYPSLNSIYDPRQKCPISEDVSRKILCLPIYYKLNDSVIQHICSLIDSSI